MFKYLYNKKKLLKELKDLGQEINERKRDLYRILEDKDELTQERYELELLIESRYEDLETIKESTLKRKREIYFEVLEEIAGKTELKLK